MMAVAEDKKCYTKWQLIINTELRMTVCVLLSLITWQIILTYTKDKKKPDKLICIYPTIVI